MDRRDFFFLQKVQEDELDDAFAGAEDALFNISLDVGFFGVMFGLAVLEQSPTPDLTVRVIGPGAAIDNVGQRCAIVGTQTVDLSVDSSSVSTAVVTPGNEKIVSLFIEFDRAESDPRIDGNSASLFFVQDESFAFFVSQGAEGLPPATPPPLQPTKVLLADVTLVQGQTQIFDADIAAGDTALGGAITDRRQDHIVIDTNFVDVRTGSFATALLALATEIDTFVAGAAAGIAYAGGPNWADATTNPATDVEAQLDKIISDLATAGVTAKIFADAIADTPDTLASGTVLSQLTSLLAFVNDKLDLSAGDQTVAGIGRTITWENNLLLNLFRSAIEFEHSSFVWSNNTFIADHQGTGGFTLRGSGNAGSAQIGTFNTIVDGNETADATLVRVQAGSTGQGEIELDAEHVKLGPDCEGQAGVEYADFSFAHGSLGANGIGFSTPTLTNVSTPVNVGDHVIGIALTGSPSGGDPAVLDCRITGANQMTVRYGNLSGTTALSGPNFSGEVVILRKGADSPGI